MSLWYYKSQGRINGPVSREELDYLASSGRVTSSTEIRSGQKGDWKRYGSDRARPLPATTNQNYRPAVTQTSSTADDPDNTDKSNPISPVEPPPDSPDSPPEHRDSSRQQAVAGVIIGILVLLALLWFWNRPMGSGTGTEPGEGFAAADRGTGSGESPHSGETAGKADDSEEGDEDADESDVQESLEEDTQATEDEENSENAADDTSESDSESEVAGADETPVNDSTTAGEEDKSTTRAVDEQDPSAQMAELDNRTESESPEFVPGDPLSKFTISAPGEATFFGLRASGRRFAFVVDQSGSMTGLRLERAKSELLSCLQSLPRHVEVLVVFFDHTIHAAPGGYQKLTPRRLKTLEQWIARVSVGGGTNVKVGMEYALTQKKKPDAAFLLTDGQFEQDTPAYVSHLNSDHSVQINTVSLVSRDGEKLLRQIAKQNNGDYRHVP